MIRRSHTKSDYFLFYFREMCTKRRVQYVSILYIVWGLKHSPISDGQMYGARVFQPPTAQVKWNQWVNFFKIRMISAEEKTICCEIQMCYPDLGRTNKILKQNTVWFSNRDILFISKTLTDFCPILYSCITSFHRSNVELDLQSLFGLHVYSCTNWLRPRKTPPFPPPLDSY
jgi:hypothetical protein